MLKQRVLTALILVPLVVWAILKLDKAYFAAVMCVLVMLGAWEWTNFIPMKKSLSRMVYVVFCALLMYTLYIYGSISSLQGTIAIAVAWWLLCFYLLAKFPFAETHWMQNSVIRAIIGLIVLLGTFTGMVMIHHNPHYGPHYILYLMIMIWTADSGAYFAGRRFGKTRLNAQVSPGKSWEGVYGAMLMTVLVAVAALFIFRIGERFPVPFIILSMMIVAVSIVGDLSESMFKRMVGIKDSGNLLPGHGGILDRIDSLTSSAPVFVAGLMLLEQFS